MVVRSHTRARTRALHVRLAKAQVERDGSQRPNRARDAMLRGALQPVVRAIMTQHQVVGMLRVSIGEDSDECSGLSLGNVLLRCGPNVP